MKFNFNYLELGMIQLLRFIVFFGAILMFGAAGAAVVNIDFKSYPPLTQIASTQGVSFSVSGGPGPSGIPATEDFLYFGLCNSTTGDFPTSRYLDVKLNGVANNLKFTFNNYGFAGVDGVGGTLATYFGVYGEVLGTQTLSGADQLIVTPAFSDIAGIRFDNGSSGQANWLISLSTLSANIEPVAAVPEPTSLALLVLGLLLLTAVASMRSRIRRS